MQHLTAIAEAARALGFIRAAALPVTAVEEEFRRFYDAYIARGEAHDLKYLERRERFDLRSIFPDAQTLLVFFYPYRFRSIETQLKAAPFKVARYAWQNDYHVLLKRKLNALMAEAGLNGRAVTDSAPLFERYWARRSGLGFIGRNGMLIDKNAGSFFLVAALLVREQVEADLPGRENTFSPVQDFTEFCRDCRLCVDACPTAALKGDGSMDLTRCISYQTIESREAPVFSPDTKKHRWTFGCDICQQVCPYNKGASSYAEEEFNMPHAAAAAVAAGETINSPSLKGSVFSRRGVKKLRENRDALKT